MKISIIFGKGIDGCGVTNGAYIFEKYVHTLGFSTQILDFDNNTSYLRAKQYDWLGNVLIIDKKSSEVSQSIIDSVNNSDICIFHSYPTRKQEKYIERFRLFIEKIKKPIIVMHDHGISSININSVPQACELFSHADLIYTQSVNGLSHCAYSEFDNNLNNKVYENPIWIDTTKLQEYYKPVEDRKKHFVYIGRMSPIKNPVMICKVDEYIHRSWDLSLIGVERSISSIDEKHGPYNQHFSPKMIQYNDLMSKQPSTRGASPSDDIRLKSYTSYSYVDGMNVLGNSSASYCGYRLTNSSEYGVRMEYTMIESFLLTIPVISPLFANYAKSPEGKLWSEYYGPIISEDPKEISDEVDRVFSNKREWTDRSNACKELIYKFNDQHSLIPKYLENILTNGKRENKVSPIDKLSEILPDAKKRRLSGEIVMSTPTNIMNREPSILVDGKKQIIYPTQKESNISLLDF